MVISTQEPGGASVSCPVGFELMLAHVAQLVLILSSKFGTDNILLSKIIIQTTT